MILGGEHLVVSLQSPLSRCTKIHPALSKVANLLPPVLPAIAVLAKVEASYSERSSQLAERVGSLPADLVVENMRRID